MITTEYIAEKYCDLFEGYGKLDGELHFHTDLTVPPVKTPVRRIPVPLRDQVEAELKTLCREGIIAKANDEPATFVSGLLIIRKPSAPDKIRICIDPKPLNCSLIRTEFYMPTIDDVLPELTKAKWFSLVDAKEAFWHCQLDTSSSRLTMFDTPFGHYRWLRLPYGVKVAPEEFYKKFSDALCDLRGVKCIADDVLIFGSGDTVEEAKRDHDKNLLALLQCCREKNIRLNKTKMRLNCVDGIRFMGHVLTQNGIIPDSRKVEAIKNMPRPTDRPGLLRVLGMAQFLARYAPRFSEITSPLRELLKQTNEFCWRDLHQQAYDRLLRLLSEAPVLQYYDVDKPVTVQCDASRQAIAAVLMQNNKPIEFASRKLN